MFIFVLFLVWLRFVDQDGCCFFGNFHQDTQIYNQLSFLQPLIEVNGAINSPMLAVMRWCLPWFNFSLAIFKIESRRWLLKLKHGYLPELIIVSTYIFFYIDTIFYIRLLSILINVQQKYHLIHHTTAQTLTSFITTILKYP